MIDSGEGEIFEGKVPQFLQRGMGGNPARSNVGEQRFDLLGGHAT
jgi:hypothetical protein